MGMGKKVEGRDGYEPWRSAKLVHTDREGGNKPMKGSFSRHQLMMLEVGDVDALMTRTRLRRRMA